MFKTASIIAFGLFAHSAQAGSLDHAMSRIQVANWAADVPGLQAICQELDLAAKDAPTAETLYVAAYCHYRVTGAAQKDPQRHGAAIDAAANQAVTHLEQASAMPGDYRAECLALLSGVYGMQIGQSPLKAVYLGPKAGQAIAEAEVLAPKNPRVLYFKAVGKLFTPALFGGDKEAALEALDASIALLPAGRTDAVNWGLEDAYIWRSIALAADSPAEALRSVESALALAPEHGWALYQKAQLTGKP